MGISKGLVLPESVAIEASVIAGVLKDHVTNELAKTRCVRT